MVVACPVSLYPIDAVIVLDTNGARLLSKYYCSMTLQQQESFERILFTRTHKLPNNEVSMCEGKIAVYRSNLDLLIYVVGAPEQNELALSTVLDTFFDALVEIMKPQLDKRAFLENYDTACLLLDECVDRGIILETDLNEILGKVMPKATGLDMSINEQTLTGALSFASQRLKSFLK